MVDGSKDVSRPFPLASAENACPLSDAPSCTFRGGGGEVGNGRVRSLSAREY